jgi:small subunit ribosomal protein S8
MRDSISELIIKIKNGSQAGLPFITVPYSNMMMSVLEVLEKDGYVGTPTKKGKKVNKIIEVPLIYTEDKQSKVTGVERVSKFSKRLYSGFRDLKSVKSGYGRMILTTPKGIMTDIEAKKMKLGGEMLFRIW